MQRKREADLEKAIIFGKLIIGSFVDSSFSGVIEVQCQIAESLDH